MIAAEVAAPPPRSRTPTAPTERAHRDLELGGEYQWRREGEYHLFNPETVFKLQHATRAGRYDVFKEYTALVDDQSTQARDAARPVRAPRRRARRRCRSTRSSRSPTIVKRFSTGAMSYGSISKEAHETLAIAMNRLGGKSNTGEGGEDADRFTPDANGDLRRSAIKQVASGRFGVTREYLVNADDLQIKMAQGAKPGEGGQLPGHKVYPWIAKTRHSTPGRRAHLPAAAPRHLLDRGPQAAHPRPEELQPAARVHVKLVAEVGVGTVAAGVSKAHADVVLISGHDGGTGAAPLTSLKHAGAPWELGLAETQQTLLLNGLRDRIVVQVDGQLKTGRDVVIAALLGAEEFGFATAPLVVSGCMMMRVCHLDTCPVGVATQNPELRKKFIGQARVRRELLRVHRRGGARAPRRARLPLARRGDRPRRGARHPRGRRPLEGARPRPLADPRRRREPVRGPGRCSAPRRRTTASTRRSTSSSSPRAGPRSSAASRSRSSVPIRNVNRTVGTMLGSELTRRYGGEGLPDDTIDRHLPRLGRPELRRVRAAGHHAAPRGRRQRLLRQGPVGRHARRAAPPATAPFVAEENIIAGNVILYGATAGEAFIRGVVGERFCVRNSGATAVVEGVGDHGCEYMTGGRVVVLGPTGRNFAAGMSGGIAFVYDPDDVFPALVNREMVDLEPLDDDDREWLRATVERAHREATGSPVAARLLARWESEVAAFRKVMPKDYKRVLGGAGARRERLGLVARTRPTRW